MNCEEEILTKAPAISEGRKNFWLFIFMRYMLHGRLQKNIFGGWEVRWLVVNEDKYYILTVPDNELEYVQSLMRKVFNARESHYENNRLIEAEDESIPCGCIVRAFSTLDLWMALDVIGREYLLERSEEIAAVFDDL